MAFLAPLIPYIAAAGAAVAAASSIQQGKAVKAAASFNEKIARENAAIEHERTLQRRRQLEREHFLRIGAIRQGQGASGGAQEGSVLDILSDTAAQVEIERQDIISRGAIAERSHLNTASLEKAEGEAAYKSSRMAAGSELLKGASSTYAANDRLKRTA